MLPAPLDSLYRCDDCKGTGADLIKTEAAQKAGRIDGQSWIRCWTCNGNGLDPQKFFNWSSNDV